MTSSSLQLSRYLERRESFIVVIHLTSYIILLLISNVMKNTFSLFLDTSPPPSYPPASTLPEKKSL